MIIKRFDGSINLQPHETRADLPICPYRHDWIQSECNICDFCGRNEAQEHGQEFPTIEMNGFTWFKDELKEIDNADILRYGEKIIDISTNTIILMQEGDNQRLKDISDKLRNLGFFTIKGDDKKIYQLQKDKTVQDYTCSQLCDYLEKEQEYDKDTLELIQREDNITIIAQYLPRLY